jgi:hypothetical protein
MKKSALERIKELAQKLSTEERLNLFQFLADLPDSGIKSHPPPQPPSPLTEIQRHQLTQIQYTWNLRIENHCVIYSIEGRDVFVAAFDPEAYADVFYEKVKSDKAFFNKIPDQRKPEIFQKVRERTGKDAESFTDEEIEALIPEALVRLSQTLSKRSLLEASEKIATNLPRVVAMILNRVMHTGILSGANNLSDLAHRPPEEKLNPSQIKRLLFDPDWQLLKPILGVQPRGGSDPKVDVSDGQCVKLSNEYPGLLNHWQKVEKNSKTEKHWREYALIDEADTPADLLDRLDNSLPAQESEGEDYPNIPSALALEHAARRADIPAGEYSQSRLKNFRLRGDNMRDNSNSSIGLSE